MVVRFVCVIRVSVCPAPPGFFLPVLYRTGTHVADTADPSSQMPDAQKPFSEGIRITNIPSSSSRAKA